MLTIYTRSGSPSCRIALKWLRENNLSFQQRKIKPDNLLKREEILKMILYVEDMNFLISRRSNVWKSVKKDVEDMCIKSELIPFIQKNPSVLKFPIVVKDTGKLDILAGFNMNEYGLLFSRVQRKQKLKDLLKHTAS